MAKMIPSPGSLDDFVSAIHLLNMERAKLVETSELTGASWASLEPDDEGNVMILPGEV